jgi:hypothetical protein
VGGKERDSGTGQLPQDDGLLGEVAERLLVPQQLAVVLDEEVAAAARPRLDLGVREASPDRRGQTGRARLVVSNDAVVDRHAHGRT